MQLTPLSWLASRLRWTRVSVNSHQLLVAVLLLVATSAAITSLSMVLVSDALAGAEEIVSQETAAELDDALSDMVARAREQLASHQLQEQDYRRISYEILKGYSAMEGGFLVQGRLRPHVTDSRFGRKHLAPSHGRTAHHSRNPGRQFGGRERWRGLPGWQ